MLDYLATLPDDWDSWLVYADQLSSRGDERGEWLVREQRGQGAEVGVLVDHRVVECSEWLGYRFRDAYWWTRKLARFADHPATPADLRRVFAQPISQLAVFIDFDASSEPIPAPFQIQRDRVFVAMLAWVERVFPATVPGLGRWQDISDVRLGDSVDELRQVDARTLPYYAPAVLSVALRAKSRRVAFVQKQIAVGLALASLLQASEHQRAEQQARFAPLDRDQRAVIYATSTVLEATYKQPWEAVWEAERDGPRDDWFELFSPILS